MLIFDKSGTHNRGVSTIKSIRIRLGITQAALAKSIGCTQGNVGHYENKGQTMPPDVAKRLIAFAAQHGLRLSYEDVYGPPIQEPALAEESQA